MQLRTDLKEALFPYQPDEIVALIKQDLLETKYENQTALIDTIRNYVHQNSIHKEGTIYHSKTAVRLDQRFQVLKDIRAHSKGNEFKPHLSCTPRTWAMQEIVRSFDIPFRVIQMYFTEYYDFSNQLRSHTFLEVYNKDTGGWEIQDPSGSIFYVDSLGNRRSSMDLMSLENFDAIKACKNIADCDKKNYRHWMNLDQSFKAITINYLGTIYNKKPLLFIDDDYFDLDKEMVLPKVSLRNYFSACEMIAF